MQRIINIIICIININIIIMDDELYRHIYLADHKKQAVVLVAVSVAVDL